MFNNDLILVGLVIGALVILSWVILPTALVWALGIFFPQIQFTVINVVACGVLLWVLRFVFQRFNSKE